ncbi:MAG: hypothetical protein IJS97_01160 [Prevotella sp.]|nr:hypothetical protein [Prevotella sp.]
MEKFVAIKQQFPCTEREYTTKDGEKKVFLSKGFILDDGIDSFYAEMVGDQARSCGNYDTNVYHSAQCTMRCREWKDKDGHPHYSNEIVINKLV